MKTIKIIDLLNLVYENKAPKKIKVNYGKFSEYYKYNSEIKCYETYDETTILAIRSFKDLYCEVEIIEDKIKKIGEINFMTAGTQKEKNRIMKDAINEIIKVLNYLSEKSKGNEQ